MLSRLSFAQRVALYVVLVTVALIAMFLITHGTWYDHLKLEQRTSFWNEALVAYGTLALAIVTWASVAETQRVIWGEDHRFRQSQMPVVSVYEIAPQVHLGYKVYLQNSGDGAARDVRIRIQATVKARYNHRDKDSGLNNEQGFQRIVTAHWELVASYIPKHEKAEPAIYLECDIPKEVIDNLLSLDHSVDVLELRYTDVFGAEYETSYDLTGTVFDPRRFQWNPPGYLLKSVG